jgi:hypothetical protein
MAKQIKDTEEADLVIFGLSTDRDLRIEYPELAEINEFKKLNKKEVKFCWLVGNRTSPIYSLEPRGTKIKRALSLTYGNLWNKKEELVAISEGEIPTHIQLAIERMLVFNPEYRLRARLMTQYMFDTLNEIVVLDTPISEMDIEERKKYADLLVKVHGDLPKLVQTLETSFGAKVISRKTKTEVLVNINDVIK